MESQPQNHEFRNYPENFHPCLYTNALWTNLIMDANIMNPDQTAPKGAV